MIEHQKGIVFAVAGKLEKFDKNEIKEYITLSDNKYTENMGERVDYLICNDPKMKNVKIDYARKMKVPIINENELIALIDRAESPYKK
jgi:NAD-dependent DNA ligase